MSLLGIDVGTSGCKAAVFSEVGQLLASAYEEYDVQSPWPGAAELDAVAIWEKVKNTIRKAVNGATSDPVEALAVSSLGEAMVPVSRDRQVLGSSILYFDTRGAEYLDDLRSALDSERLYRINGNALGDYYSLTKLKWIKEHQRDLYERAYRFLLWGSFVSFMLGADPVVDCSLANRTLLLDIDRGDWSDELIGCSGLDRAKLPDIVPAGTVVGTVSAHIAQDLGLPTNVIIAIGSHDQCANAVGCGAVTDGRAAYGMGTVTCITPVYSTRREPAVMIGLGLNTENHAVPGQYVSFIYNQGGVLLKWYSNTFAAAERRQATSLGGDIYSYLMSEIPQAPSGLMVLPHFATTGPPSFISDSCAVIAGLKLESTRGDILKGILEGSTFYLKECVESLAPTGIRIDEFRAVGGGSKSDAWIQTCADIMGCPFMRPTITEAGTLGAAILAGMGRGTFTTVEAGVGAMVRMERTFEPDQKKQTLYSAWFNKYRKLYPLMQEYLRELASAQVS